MGGFIDFGVDLIKGGMQKYGVSTNPIFMPGRVEPRYTEFLSFIGVSVDHDTPVALADVTTAEKIRAASTAGRPSPDPTPPPGTAS